MVVKLVSVTKPLIEGVESPGELMAYCARVSNPGNQMNNETAGKLLRYCVRNQHWSVFEMVDVTMEIQTTRDIGRQILRHNSFNFQEFSQRYADPTGLDSMVREARLQDTKNRQNSIEGACSVVAAQWCEKQKAVYAAALDVYKWAQDNGLAKEQCRVVLPEGMTMSRMYMKGSVRSWIHYCQLRMGNGTQKEHRLIAADCWAELLKVMPELEDCIDAAAN